LFALGLKFNFGVHCLFQSTKRFEALRSARILLDLEAQSLPIIFISDLY